MYKDLMNYVCMKVGMCVCRYARMNGCGHTCISLCVCMCACMDTYIGMYVNTHIHTYMYPCIHTYTDTHIYTCTQNVILDNMSFKERIYE